jgi:predicted transcriptional regulator
VGQLQQQRLHDLLAGHTVSQAITHSCATASADLTLQELVDRHILGNGQRCLMLTRGDEVLGLLSLHHIREVPRERWAAVTADEVMTPMSQMKRIRPEMGIEAALEEMAADGVNQLPVMSDGRVNGMLSREDVISYLRTLQQLGI